MRKIALMALPLFALAMSACSDDSSKNEDLATTQHDFAVKLDGMNTNPDLTTTDGPVETPDGFNASFPAPPTLGTQIDRFGRPAINTALTDPFWDNGSTNAHANHTAKQDAYNAASDPTTWTTTKPDGTNTTPALFAGALAAYDSLDGTCGNQEGFAALGTTDYSVLAGVLTNDRLWVNTGSGMCSTYLAVEVGALSTTTPTDCGGRAPGYSVIDITYTALANGNEVTQGCISSSGACAVSDGLTQSPAASDPDGAPTATFPFLQPSGS